ncbi:unnamed protein product [Arabidopsis thaliana]|uniref:Uncharacterized protein n=2 Tax=Arabidopsis thaliana TaxID=3702 RepID=A0A654FE48_ARATH|nr:uncharacterized protein AT3G48475 [Arabidopsis thaliana]ANM63772.1 hypothetical protein AT3G48475 [Arabidopsis thaliana]CAA0385057.1 unnamed protein product [Arabidopsis thaliana]VYS59754.1 unnamed protein product [Arabidopsis thaliana]|eukprot:NP_001325843.1 hypothetical protein AT3G48475 [Arabidopsis thaliana]
MQMLLDALMHIAYRRRACEQVSQGQQSPCQALTVALSQIDLPSSDEKILSQTPFSMGGPRASCLGFRVLELASSLAASAMTSRIQMDGSRATQLELFAAFLQLNLLHLRLLYQSSEPVPEFEQGHQLYESIHQLHTPSASSVFLRAPTTSTKCVNCFPKSLSSSIRSYGSKEVTLELSELTLASSSPSSLSLSVSQFNVAKSTISLGSANTKADMFLLLRFSFCLFLRLDSFTSVKEADLLFSPSPFSIVFVIDAVCNPNSQSIALSVIESSRYRGFFGSITLENIKAIELAIFRTRSPGFSSLPVGNKKYKK